MLEIQVHNATRAAVKLKYQKNISFFDIILNLTLKTD